MSGIISELSEPYSISTGIPKFFDFEHPESQSIPRMKESDQANDDDICQPSEDSNTIQLKHSRAISIEINDKSLYSPPKKLGPYQVGSPQQTSNNQLPNPTCNIFHTEDSKEDFDSPHKIMYAELIRMNVEENGGMNFEQLTRNTGNNQSEEKQA